jgi:hypothetical protein
LTDLPAYPLRDYTDVECVYGANIKHYLTMEELGKFTEEQTEALDPWCEVVGKLFFKGGKLENYGVRPRSDVHVVKLYRAIQALLKSWGPKHEEKEATVAVLLANYCEAIPPEGK